jgi:hydroxypyruvate isomerase
LPPRFSAAARPGNVAPAMTQLDRRRLLAAAAAAPLCAAGGAVAQDKPARTKNTRFAANVEMWWTKRPFLDRVRAAADLGFPAIEFWPWRGKDVDALAALCEQLGIAVAQFTAWGFKPGLNDPANHDAFVAEVEASCAVAKKLRCAKMTVVGGDDRPGKTQEEMHAQIIAGLERAAEVAEQHDVMLILEPMNVRVDHKGHCLWGSEAAVRICRAVGSTHVKINWDLYHMQISEGDLCGRLREGKDQLGYAQVADHPGRTEPGTGEIHYPRVLRELKELGYDGFVGVECRPKEDEVTAAKRLAQADAW